MNSDLAQRSLSALAEVNNLPYEVPEKAAVDGQANVLLTPDYIRKQNVLPIRFDGENNRTLVVGMADPTNVLAVDDIQIATALDCRVAVAARGGPARLARPAQRGRGGRAAAGSAGRRGRRRMRRGSSRRRREWPAREPGGA